MTSEAEPATDLVLRKLIAGVEANQGHRIEVTLYLPWGAATGEIVPSIQFAQNFRGYLVEHEAVDIADEFLSFESDQIDTGDTSEYVFLGKGSRTLVAGQVVGNGEILRIRLADVSAWAPGPVDPQ